MPRRVNPIVLLGLITTLILSVGVFANAQPGGGTADEAIAVGQAQLGKPFAHGTDGPDSFSCAGLIRHILRTIGVDGNAPWSAEGMLGAYPSVAPGDLQPGDLMLWPDHATIYVGGGMVLNANEAEGVVTHTPVDALGPPMGIVRPPYGGSQGGATQPVNDTSQPLAVEPMAAGPTAAEPTADPLASQPAPDPLATEQIPVDPMAAQLPAAEPVATQPMGTEQVPVEPTAAEPAAEPPPQF